MIGLSVSFCIRDIAEGNVSLDQVERIVSGTLCETPDDWEEVIDRYKNNYWWDFNPEECEKILRKMIAEGKVEQPRLKSGRFPIIGNRIHWVESELDIVWGPTN